MPTTTQMIDTILRSGICLRPAWAQAFQIARMAERLPQSVRRGGCCYGYRYHSVVPNTVQANLEAAYQRASEVLSCNERRRAARRAA